jgi:hypothetical protein
MSASANKLRPVPRPLARLESVSYSYWANVTVSSDEPVNLLLTVSPMKLPRVLACWVSVRFQEDWNCGVSGGLWPIPLKNY